MTSQLSFISILIMVTLWVQSQSNAQQVILGTPITREAGVDSLSLNSLALDHRAPDSFVLDSLALARLALDSLAHARLKIVEFAKNYIGTPYLYASLDPTRGFDCSGFVRYVFKQYNINLPRSSREYEFLGAALKPEGFKVGDVIIFYGFRDTKQIGHVGIICEANGMKSKFIHSSSGKVRGVTISQLDLVQYTRRFYKCIDVIGL